MGTSLQDQLLKSGLVDKKKASQARKQQQKARRQKSRPEEAERARSADARKAEHDRELNLQRKAAAEHKALQAQVRQLIESNRIPLDDGDIAYHFTDGGKIRSLRVTPELQRKLASGSVAIAILDGNYALVPAEAAERISARDPTCVIRPNDSDERTGEDDPYAGHEVPDDLTW